jgi:hypothetical protein
MQARVQGRVRLKDSISFKLVQIGSFGPQSPSKVGLSHNGFGIASNANFALFCNFIAFDHTECIANYTNAHCTWFAPNAIWAKFIFIV